VPAIAFMRVAIAVGELIFISALMQAGLALLMAYHFHRATTMGMPANLAVIPLTQVLMPAAAAAVALGYISTTLAKPAVWISGLRSKGIAGTVHWLGRRAGRWGFIDRRPARGHAFARDDLARIAALALRCWRHASRTRWPLSRSGAAVWVAGWIAFVPSRPHLRAGVMEMTTIDVGQGDSILLSRPRAAPCSSMPEAFRNGCILTSISANRWSLLICGIAASIISTSVVITHPHADHLGGMPAVIANFIPANSGSVSTRPVGELAPIVAQAERAGMKVSVKKEGDEFDYGGAHFHMLAPGRDQITGSMRPNDDCLVFTATFGGTTALA
jgi:competence protein ComEC